MADENVDGDLGDKGGNEPGAFFSNLSEENQADPVAEKFKGSDHDSMFKSYKELESVVGKKGVILPKEGDADDLNRFNAEIGGITDPTKFELPGIEEQTAKDAKYSQDAWKQLCADLGLRPDQATKGQERIIESSLNTIKQLQMKEDQLFGEADQKVRAEMGEEYDLNMSRVEKLIQNNGVSVESAERLFGSVKKDPEAFQALSKIAGLLSENVIGKISPLSAGKSPEQAQARIDEIMKDPDYTNDSESVRDPLINEMNDLNRILMGSKR